MCFKTLYALTNNVIKNPTEDKFKTVNLANAAISTRVGKINGGKIVLKGFGFEEDLENEKMVLKNYDAKLFADGVTLV